LEKSITYHSYDNLFKEVVKGQTSSFYWISNMNIALQQPQMNVQKVHELKREGFVDFDEDT